MISFGVRERLNEVRHKFSKIKLSSAREVYFGLCWTSIAPFGKDPMLLFFLELSAHSSIQWYDNQIRIEIWLWPLSTNSSTRTKSSKVRFSFDPLKFCPCSRTVREGFIGLGEFGTRKVPNEFQTNESKVGNVKIKTLKSFSYENEATEENNSDYESAEGDHQGNFSNSKHFVVRDGSYIRIRWLFDGVEARRDRRSP